MRFGAGVLNMIPGPAVAIIACLAAGYTSSCLRSAMLAVSSDASPNGEATMFSLLPAFGNAGRSLAPWRVESISK